MAGPMRVGISGAQVLVYHDLLGMMQHPHYVKVTPKFCKQYASLGLVIQDALRQYTEDVRPSAFHHQRGEEKGAVTVLYRYLAFSNGHWRRGGFTFVLNFLSEFVPNFLFEVFIFVHRTVAEMWPGDHAR